MKRIVSLIERIFHYYNDKQIPLASAALCYYMIMTVFPLIICLYTLLGRNYDQALRLLSFVESFLSADAVLTIRGFLNYVAQNHSRAMFYAGMTVLLTSASASVRSMEITIGRMQGGQRYRGVGRIIFSLIFAVAFLIAVWFSILAMFTSHDLLTMLNSRIPFIDISGSWYLMKYVMLAGFMFLLLWGIYGVSRKKHLKYRTWPGAIVGSLGIVAMSLIFSAFIAASARYSLVYGSMASVILLMLWMYFSCQVIYVGAAFNIALRDVREMEEKSDEDR